MLMLSLEKKSSRRTHSLPQIQGTGEHQQGVRYCGHRHRWLRASCPKEGTVERPWHRTKSTRSGGWTTHRRERHCQLQPHLHELLGPKEVPCSKEWHTGASLGVCQQIVQNSSDSPPSEQSEWCTHWTPSRTIRWTPGCKQDLGQGQPKVLLVPGKKQCWEVVPTLRRLCNQMQSLNKGSGPYASVQCWGTIWEDNHSHSGLLLSQ